MLEAYIKHEGGVRKPFIPYLRGSITGLGTAKTEVGVTGPRVAAPRGIAAKQEAIAILQL